MDLTLPIVTAAASLYAVIWIMTARHLYATHYEYPDTLHDRRRRFRLAAKYLALALVWPLFLLYLAVTGGTRNGRR